MNGKADEIDDILIEISLIGEELDLFEESEQFVEKATFRTSLDRDLMVKYNELLENKIIDNSISLSEYIEAITVPEPTDPVTIGFRNDIQRPQPGDIFITNGTSLWGLTGHAGIFLSDGTILSIEGPGSKPVAYGIPQWVQKYQVKEGSWTKIYRPKNAYKPSSAATWGASNIRGKNFTYGITNDTLKLNPTYCSKIVFQSYWFGNTNNGDGMLLPSLVTPYGLPNVFLSYGYPDHVATWAG